MTMLLSCEDENTLTADKENKINLPAYIAPAPDSIDYSKVSSILLMQHNTYVAPDKVTIGENSFIDANFYDLDGSDYALDVGSVTVNSQAMNQISYTETNGTVYSYNSDLSYNFGSSYSWNVPGTSIYPSFTGTLITPTSKMDISNISNGDSHSKATDLVINWNGTYDPNANIAIQIIPNTNQEGYVNYTSDSGSFTIPSSQLTSLTNGDVELLVTRGLYEYKTLSNNEIAFIGAITTEHIYINLTN
jgi:hypothetical protein